jgi:hypothetical protein
MAELSRPGGAAKGGELREARISQPCGEISLGMVPRPNDGKREGVSSDALEAVAFADDRGASGRFPDSDKNDDILGFVSIRVSKNKAYSVGVTQAIKQPSAQHSESPTDSFLRATQVVHRCCVLAKRSRG